MTKYPQRALLHAHHSCAICGRPGGEAARSALRNMGFAIPTGEPAYAHGKCLGIERAKRDRKGPQFRLRFSD